jgi:hypothetical protein
MLEVLLLYFFDSRKLAEKQLLRKPPFSGNLDGSIVVSPPPQKKKIKPVSFTDLDEGSEMIIF